MKLKNKVAIITGGSRGIGRAIALAFVREGASISICSRTKEEVKEAEKEISGIYPYRVLAISADISKQIDVERIIRLTKDKFGRIDILVNNAGVLGPIGPFRNNNFEEWVETFEINFVGSVRMIKSCLPYLVSQKHGKIINLSGGGAVSPRPNFSAYGASKAAIVRFTETLAKELKCYNVGVNSIAPGSINTKMTREVIRNKKRVGLEEYTSAKKQLSQGNDSLERVASLAVFLASDASNGLSGRLISAAWDNWSSLGRRIGRVMKTDAFTVRRIKEDEAK
jgi:NAD(P)-dependent dehydrogenase (short-subunit alcohol dehydrogenase family)